MHHFNNIVVYYEVKLYLLNCEQDLFTFLSKFQQKSKL